MVGLGGIWIEAIGDVRVMPADAPPEQICAELMALKSAKLLQGFRGTAAVDVDAVVNAAGLIGRLMLTEAAILEVDVNPLVAHPAGQGATALDALIITDG